MSIILTDIFGCWPVLLVGRYVFFFYCLLSILLFTTLFTGNASVSYRPILFTIGQLYLPVVSIGCSLAHVLDKLGKAYNPYSC